MSYEAKGCENSESMFNLVGALVEIRVRHLFVRYLKLYPLISNLEIVEEDKNDKGIKNEEDFRIKVTDMPYAMTQIEGCQ